MAELVDLRGAELGDIRKKPKPQILGADVGEKIPVQSHVLRSGPADQHALAATDPLVQLARLKGVLVRHRRDTRLHAQSRISASDAAESRRLERELYALLSPAGLTGGSSPLRKSFCEEDGLPGRKRVHTRLPTRYARQ